MKRIVHVIIAVVIFVVAMSFYYHSGFRAGYISGTMGCMEDK